MGFDTKVTTFKSNLYEDLTAIDTLSNCDFLFGCMDSIDGRHLLNCISSFYLIPYLDIGVKIISDKKGGLDQICGTIHFLLPGESSLQTRGVYTPEELRAANLLRVDREEFEEQKKSGYIVDVDIEAPAVISINMQAASLAVNEFLSRVHSIKVDAIEEFDIIRFSLTDFYFLNQKSNDPIDKYLLKYIGRGIMNPLLNMPNFSHEAVI